MVHRGPLACAHPGWHSRPEERPPHRHQFQGLLSGGENWVRVLANECIKKLCPVLLPDNGSEYIIALSAGKNEGYIHLGTIKASDCFIIWAIYIPIDLYLILLVEIPQPPSRNYFKVVYYDIDLVLPGRKLPDIQAVPIRELGCVCEPTDDAAVPFLCPQRDHAHPLL